MPPAAPPDSRPRSKIVDADGAPLDEATLAHFFRPPAPELFDDPVCGAALRRLAAEDPDIIAAVADVDRTLIRDNLDGTPEQRLRCMVNNLNALTRGRSGKTL